MPGKKILVVDDEPDMTKAIGLRLEAAGYETVLAYDGQEAMDKVREAKPDLILLDLMLPKIDGYKVCRLLKFDVKWRHIPIIMLTARAQESDKVMGQEVGADAYLTKPFKSEDLMATIEKFLKKT